MQRYANFFDYLANMNKKVMLHEAIRLFVSYRRAYIYAQ